MHLFYVFESMGLKVPLKYETRCSGRIQNTEQLSLFILIIISK